MPDRIKKVVPDLNWWLRVAGKMTGHTVEASMLERDSRDAMKANSPPET